MSALKKYLQACQSDAAALERVADTLCHFIQRPLQEEQQLTIDLAEMAFKLASGLNEALDSVNLPDWEGK